MQGGAVAVLRARAAPAARRLAANQVADSRLLMGAVTTLIGDVVARGTRRTRWTESRR